jgi:opacity protein-like surface antigen
MTQRDQVLRSRIGLIGRGGYPAQPDLLLYGLAGLEFGHFAYPDEASVLDGDNGVWALGFTTGAGAEWKLTNHWSLRGEYRYLHFGFGRSDSRGSNRSLPRRL